jgi:hypothetical protein
MSFPAVVPYTLTSRRTTYLGIPAPKRNVTPLGHAALASHTRKPPGYECRLPPAYYLFWNQTSRTARCKGV